MLRRPIVALLVALAIAAPAAARAIPPERRTQFVLLSFDTTPGPMPRGRPDMFHAIHAALNRRRPPGAPPSSYTLFISTGGLQLDPAGRRHPAEALPFLGVLPRNRPTIRYARDLHYLRGKVENLRVLAGMGVELSSHGVRHDHGAPWDLPRWRAEVRDNARILDLFGLPHPTGFRAPFLEAGPSAYRAFSEAGARYDAGCLGDGSWPTRDPETGVWRFCLPMVNVEGRPNPVLFFDDNMRTVLGALARERGLNGAAAEELMDEGYHRAAMQGFLRRYRGNRAPFLVSGHGTMQRAMMRTLRHVCELPDVRCATMREALEYVEAHPELEGAPPLRGQLATAD